MKPQKRNLLILLSLFFYLLIACITLSLWVRYYDYYLPGVKVLFLCGGVMAALFNTNWFMHLLKK